MNAEGDTLIREDTFESLGTLPKFLKVLFGSIIKIAQPQPTPSFPTRSRPPTTPPDPISSPAREQQADDKMFESNQGHFIDLTLGPDYMDHLFKPAPDDNRTPLSIRLASAKALLIDVLPDSGYFFAGAVAGAFSRTATAPLDRLKVYLIANVDAKPPIAVTKQAGAAAAVKQVGRPLVVAFQELWKAGKMRSLFAGTTRPLNALDLALT